MKKKETKTTASPLNEPTPEETQELQEIYEERKIKFGNDKQKVNQSSQPIYNVFNFFIGGPNNADIVNDQYGKPNVPPYGGG